MIVVGFLDPAGGSGELAVAIARRAGATGARVEMVGVAPADASGDDVLLALAAGGVGHATVIRTGATALDPADLELALRYLPDIRAVVLVRPDAALVPVAAAATAWSGAGLVVVRDGDGGSHELTDAGAADAAPDLVEADLARAIVLDPPGADEDGTFAGFVAALVVRVDAGAKPEAALQATLTDLAADAVAAGT